MPYDYIKRAYGKEFKPGMLVTFDEYDGKPGKVMHRIVDNHYVKVRFDDGSIGRCHPNRLTVVTEENPNALAS